MRGIKSENQVSVHFEVCFDVETFFDFPGTADGACKLAMPVR